MNEKYHYHVFATANPIGYCEASYDALISTDISIHKTGCKGYTTLKESVREVVIAALFERGGIVLDPDDLPLKNIAVKSLSFLGKESE